MCQVMITSDRKQSTPTENSFASFISCSSLNSSSTMSAPPPPPQSFPYDHLFKILTIGDAGVGKVCEAAELFPCLCWYPFSSEAGLGVRGRGETVLDVRSYGVTYFGRERLPFPHATHIDCGNSYLPLGCISSHSLILFLSNSHTHFPFLTSLLLPLGSHQSFCGSLMIPSMITYSPQLASTSR